MKKLVLSFLVISALLGVVPSCFALEYPLPTGCYVAFGNPGYCYSIPNGQTLSWNQSLDQNWLATQYGWTMAVVISRAFEHKLDFDQCFNDYNSLVDQFNVNVNDYNSLLNECNANIDDYNSLLGKYTKQVKLVKKLRKACGAPCKKIK